TPQPPLPMLGEGEHCTETRWRPSRTSVGGGVSRLPCHALWKSAAPCPAFPAGRTVIALAGSGHATSPLGAFRPAAPALPGPPGLDVAEGPDAT
ncbi:MAG TPA: hypothetical protein VFW96_10630, partial [Thermomicrobiales bacterium]|nr:hypothetical protein [Thermomicrobiales bacterium]